jgi:uncharacterized protein YgbK (DUF1537 family)
VEKEMARSLPAALLVVGGATLIAVARLLSVKGLLVKGEIAPGVPLAEIVGGPMDSRQIITKAGDFGERETLARAIQAAVEAH